MNVRLPLAPVLLLPLLSGCGASTENAAAASDDLVTLSDLYTACRATEVAFVGDDAHLLVSQDCDSGERASLGIMPSDVGVGAITMFTAGTSYPDSLFEGTVRVRASANAAGSAIVMGYTQEWQLTDRSFRSRSGPYKGWRSGPRTEKADGSGYEAMTVIGQRVLPDGARAVLLGQNGAVALADFTTVSSIELVDGETSAYSSGQRAGLGIDVSADGRALVVAFEDENHQSYGALEGWSTIRTTLMAFDLPAAGVPSPPPTPRFKLDLAFAEHLGSGPFALSPDGTLIAVVPVALEQGDRRTGTIPLQLRDAHDGHLVRSIGGGLLPSDVGFSGDGVLLHVGGTWDDGFKGTRVLRIADGAQVAQFPNVYGAALSPDHTLVALPGNATSHPKSGQTVFPIALKPL